ncbi:MAG: urease accessory protein UreF [Burkholderiales bacterium]|nr:urease accessory protein UreF [Burkholderiales bacterium]
MFTALAAATTIDIPRLMSEPHTPPSTLSLSTRMRLMWLASPALPVGGFSYSEGLEAAVESGLIRSEGDAARWLRDQLKLSLARSDMPVVAQALMAWQRHDLPRIEALNNWVLRTRESSEIRLQTEQMGRSLVEWLRNSGPTSHTGRPGQLDERTTHCAALKPAPTWPVAFALAVAQATSPTEIDSTSLTQEALLAYAFGWAENMVQAAIKAVPLGQSAGQRILQSLTEVIPDAIEHAQQLTDGQRQAFTPMLAILSAQHETQYSRLFRS